MLRFIKLITLILILLSLSTSFDSSIYYIFFGIIVILFFLYTLIRHKIQKFETIDLIASSFILIWAYGFILGLIKETIYHMLFLICRDDLLFSYFVFVGYKIDIQILTKYSIIKFCFVLAIASMMSISMEIHYLCGYQYKFLSTGQFRIYFLILQ